MNAFRTTASLLILLAAFTGASCSNGRAPTFPDAPLRIVADFTGEGPIFDNWRYDYNETDLSVLLNGPDPPSGEEGDPAYISSAHWAVAVTIEHDLASGYDYINYAWLDDVDSPSGPTPQKTGCLYGSDDWDLVAAKVGACYFYNDETPNDSTIEVAVTCMCKLKDWGADYEIGVISTAWLEVKDVLSFPDTPQTAEFPVIIDDRSDWFEEVPPPPDDSDAHDYCPDIAFDPMTGDKHVVWTNTYDDSPDYMLAYARYDRSANDWSGAYAIREPTYPKMMWHPRIDTGDPDGDGDKVGVVYSAYHPTSGPYAGYWHVGMSFWEPDETNLPADASYYHLQYASGEHCGMPRLDIAPQGNTGRYCSIVFMNEYSLGLYQVVETNNKRDDFLPLVYSTQVQGVYGAPVIHYDEDVVSVSYFLPYQGDWDLYGTRFGLDDEEMSDDWAIIESAIDGTFAPTESSAPGVEPGIVNMGDDNSYWAVWCNRIDDDADQVWANYGDSTP